MVDRLKVESLVAEVFGTSGAELSGPMRAGEEADGSVAQYLLTMVAEHQEQGRMARATRDGLASGDERDYFTVRAERADAKAAAYADALRVLVIGCEGFARRLDAVDMLGS